MSRRYDADTIMSIVAEVHGVQAELRVKDGKLIAFPFTRVKGVYRLPERVSKFKDEIRDLMDWAASNVDDYPPADAAVAVHAEYVLRAADGLAMWDSPGVQETEHGNRMKYQAELMAAHQRYLKAIALYEQAEQREQAQRVSVA